MTHRPPCETYVVARLRSGRTWYAYRADAIDGARAEIGAEFDRLDWAREEAKLLNAERGGCDAA